MKNQNIYDELAENLVEIIGEAFNATLCLRLLIRSPELQTAATSNDLLGDVCKTLVRDNFDKLIEFRRQKLGACHMYPHEVAALTEALKPLCVRAWPLLNAMLAEDRDTNFQPRDYIMFAGTLYHEEAPSITFVRFLNDMQRLKEIHSKTYELNIQRISRVHALNRVANIMPQEFHQGTNGKLKPGQTFEAAKWDEILAWRELTGIHTKADLLKEAGLT